MSEPPIFCPRCGKRSFHPKDIEERYCGFCHEWQANMQELPTYCACCGAYLMGGATEHAPECAIRKLIEETFKR